MRQLKWKRVVIPVLAGLALAWGCGPAEEDAAGVGQGQSELRGGDVDQGDKNTFMIAMDYSGGAGYLCTSTLIGRRVLLSAAHCVAPEGTIPGPNRIRATNDTTMPDWDADAGWLPTTTYVMNAKYDPDLLVSTDDTSVVQLAKAPPIKRKPINRQPLTGLLGAQLRAVGYGIIEQNGGGAGTRRQATMAIRGMDPNNLMTGNMSNAGICQGDSGGPSFHTFDDGVERQIGIHSYGLSTAGCQDGTDVRTDYYKKWIDARLAELDADCTQDNVCKPDCTPADVDCLCVADGTCEATCGDKSLDPDCAEACGSNGICGTACASADPDCNAPFKGCDSPDDCATRICVSDPQSYGTYCSQSCTASGECPDGWECTENVCKHKQLAVAQPGDPCTLGQTYCAGDTFCTGPADQPTTCQKRCFSALTCDGTCNSGQNGMSYCTPLLGVAPPPEDPKGCGCTSAGTAMPVVAALALLALIRRRNSAV